ncbi:DUF4143 domain-containing protein [uncultured Gulosibacter sp.]|uniref:DUF4143 domain-containing protein n=1 Tax=uncultured Gulosibacter sp. TaxID=1339167 RepID=UPI00288B13DF|nr:DUF4143 domain-containing protein [uncultured Gulosibacter sp.]
MTRGCTPVPGGSPDLLEAGEHEASLWLRDYLRTVVEIDVPGLGPRLNPGSIHRLVAALGAGSDALRQDLPAAGLHFESLVMRDIQVCAQPIAGTPSSWRDSQTGLEVDAVLELPDGRWACFHKPLVSSTDQN